MNSIRGYTGLVTGASAGIGKETCRALAGAGVNLILVARRKKLLEDLSDELTSEHGIDCEHIVADVRDADQLGVAFASLKDSWQTIDILVNNAGLGRSASPAYSISTDDVDDMVDTNIKGLLNSTRLVVPGMIDRGRGHVINIGSTAGHDVYQGGVVYCATKHAVGAITRGLKLDLHGTPVRVSTIDPGMVETDFSLIRFRGDNERAAAVYANTQPLTPTDIADAVLYCATRPARVNISEIILTSVDQSSASLIHRREQAETS